MTKRPTRLVLGPHVHAIEWTDKKITKKGLLGRAERLHNRIQISTAQSLTQQGSTLLHEIDHMGFYDTPIHHFAGWNDDVEEAMISTMEGFQLEMFVRPENRQIVRWLQSLGD